jgi:hypothetical protein
VNAFHPVDDGDGLFGCEVDDVEGGAVGDEQVVVRFVDGHVIVAAIAGNGDLFVEYVLLGAKGLADQR